MLNINHHNGNRRIPTTRDRLYIRHNLNYNIRLKTKESGYIRKALVRSAKSGTIKCYSAEPRFVPTSHNKILSLYADIGTKAAIKAKRLKNVVWIDEIQQNDFIDTQINGMDYETIRTDAYLNILNKTGYEYINPVLLAVRGANNVLNRLQREIAGSASLESPKADEGEQEQTTRYKTESHPVRIEPDVIRREKLEYIFLRLTPEEAKLFRVYSEHIERVKDRKTGKYTTARVNISIIRTEMNYGESIDRSTIGKRIKRTISKVRDLMKDYDNLSKNMLSFNDNSDSGDIIRINRKKAAKVQAVSRSNGTMIKPFDAGEIYLKQAIATCLGMKYDGFKYIRLEHKKKTGKAHIINMHNPVNK